MWVVLPLNFEFEFSDPNSQHNTVLNLGRQLAENGLSISSFANDALLNSLGIDEMHQW